MEQINTADLPAEQISLDRCRQLLGDEAVGLSDDEVDLIRQRADAMAHVVVQIFLEKGATSR